MISKVTIKNYRSYDYKELDFDSLVAIVGPNDSGKSNLWWAVYIVLFNKPMPVECIRRGESHLEVTIELDDGKTIARHRDLKNQYVILTGVDGTRTPYKGIKGLDEIVANFTGFREVVIDVNDTTDNLQFARINELPFLLSKEAESIGRRILRLMVGSGVENAKANLISDKKEITKAVSTKEEMIVAMDTVVKTLSEEKWEAFAKEYEYLQAQQEQLEQLDVRVEQAFGYMALYSRISERYDYVKNGMLPELTTALEQLEELYRQYMLLPTDQSHLHSKIGTQEQNLSQKKLEIQQCNEEYDILKTKSTVCPKCNYAF